MAFVRVEDLKEWASPKELDAILGRSARLEARLASHTSPTTYLAVGAFLGIVYMTLRNQLPTARATELAAESLV
jgi:hypothetical protein